MFTRGALRHTWRHRLVRCKDSYNLNHQEQEQMEGCSPVVRDNLSQPGHPSGTRNRGTKERGREKDIDSHLDLQESYLTICLKLQYM